MTESTAHPSAATRRGRRLDRPGPRDVVLPHRSPGSDQLPLHRHGRRGPSRHRRRSPRATWKLNGTLQVTTKDNASPTENARLSRWPPT